MNAPKQLRQPDNWKDFETLCKKLWEEIWNCPEIKKNGRQGQSQNGVDVYGIPSFDKGYYGIQCKGKDIYTHKQLTKKEIDLEIEKAKSFIPKLKKFYFATTAIKDSKIEEYIRIKNIESIENNSFEIHLFAWEDIVELIDENRQTHDYYVNSQNFKTQHNCILTFQNGKNVLNKAVPFERSITKYLLKPSLEELMGESAGIVQVMKFAKHTQEMAKSMKSPWDRDVNYTNAIFSLKLQNTGLAPIENFKVFLIFEGEFRSVETYQKGNGIFGVVTGPVSYNTYIDSKSKKGEFSPLSKILVGDDSITSDKLIIKPISEPRTIKIKWKLVSKDYKNEGELLLNLDIEIKRKYNEFIVDDPSDVRTIEGELVDYIKDRE